MNLRYSPPSPPPPPQQADLARLEDDAIRALQQGRERDAIALWNRIVGLMPTHLRALTVLGQYAFRHSDFASARRLFEQATRVDGSDPRQWTSLALACQRLGDDAAEDAALFRAASADPQDLLTLLLRGQFYERQGKARQAAQTFGAAAAVAPPAERLAPELLPLLHHALEFQHQHQQAFAQHIDSAIAPALDDCQGEDLARFKTSVDILLQRKRRYDSQPMQYYYPGLAPGEFFDRSQFPWFDSMEAGTAAIRDEFLAVLQSDQGFAPYITYSADQPVHQWAALNHSPNWTAFHLVERGRPVAANAARCPQTMALWAQAPAPDQPGRTPAAMFSLLRPRTHIPAHTGSSNVRLVVHLPLIVPPGCRFRVGNSVREWQVGRAWAFDDTIEHEAWNDSDQLRVVLLFDVWHPALSTAERRMITALSAGLNGFAGGADAAPADAG